MGHRHAKFGHNWSIKGQDLRGGGPMQRCKMVYRALNGQAPKYLTSLFNKSNAIHSYRTRAAISDGLLIPKARTNSGKQSFSHVSSVEWNQLPHDVRQAPSKYTFSARFWKALLTRN